MTLPVKSLSDRLMSLPQYPLHLFLAEREERRSLDVKQKNPGGTQRRETGGVETRLD